MTTIDAEKSVAQLVIEQPGLMRIFDKLGIDYCCGGKLSLQQACAKRGLDAGTVLLTVQAMAQAGGGLGEPQQDWSKADLASLCDHIEQTHHRHLTAELPRLQMLVDKVARVHGSNHPELLQVRDVFTKASRELLAHAEKEERDLFPLIRQLESGEAAGAAGTVTAGSVAALIEEMEIDHDDTGEALETLRRLTGDYVPPADACGSYRAMLAGLEELERETHVHVHKENNMLFPRAVALEGASK